MTNLITDQILRLVGKAIYTHDFCTLLRFCCNQHILLQESDYRVLMNQIMLLNEFSVILDGIQGTSELNSITLRPYNSIWLLHIIQNEFA